MLELGDEAADAHREAGRRAAELGIHVVALGDMKNELAGGAGDLGETAGDPNAAARAALALTDDGDWILVKASRGMRLERVVEALAKVSGP
jgi:UDP-N-acetylmuramyl pentapeptide synthase